jgi:hypothetical protein
MKPLPCIAVRTALLGVLLALLAACGASGTEPTDTENIASTAQADSPSVPFNFGGAYGYVDGLPTTNPATNNYSCPPGYTAQQVYGTKGNDLPVHYCWQPQVAGTAPIYDFGGMWGYVNGNPVINAVTGDSTCPAGFTSQVVLHTVGIDYQLTVCYRPYAGTDSYANFGGMYGTVNGQPAANPATAGSSCPAGYLSSQVLGTSGIDWPLYYCYQPAESLPLDFGGAWGWVQGQLQVNPATNASSCPDGYTATIPYGQDGRDFPVTYCWRPHVSGRNPIYDFGGMWGYVNGNPVFNAVTGSSTCPGGFTSQTVLNTTDVDYTLTVCYRPYAGTDSYANFGGMYGNVNGQPAENPVSAGSSCPAGYLSSQVLGTSNVDWPLYYCYQPAEPSPLDFGGAWGWVGGKPWVNPATGFSSCPDGYTATTVYGQNGRDYPVTYCWRPHVAGRDPIYDFGGMWGSVNGNLMINAVTGGSSCPGGFTQWDLLYNPGVDYPLSMCFRPHDSTDSYASFGGMYGTVNGQPAENPATGGSSCPAGYLSSQVLGTSGIDWPLYYCYQPAEALPLDFGGMWGWVDGQIQVNPTTGVSYCPKGYTATTVYGQSNRDYPVTYCWRPHADGRDPDYDFGGMWGTVNATQVANGTTGQASCPSGYNDQQVLGTDGVDLPLHACWRPHQLGTPLELFGGMVGTINGVAANNPASGGHSCPTGYATQQVLGTSNVDWPLSYCLACPAGQTLLADTNACVTLTPWDGSPLPNGARIAMQVTQVLEENVNCTYPLCYPPVEPIPPAWVTLTPWQPNSIVPAYDYLDAAGTVPSSGMIFTITLPLAQAGAGYQNIVLQGSDGNYVTVDDGGALASFVGEADAGVLALDLKYAPQAVLWWPCGNSPGCHPLAFNFLAGDWSQRATLCEFWSRGVTNASYFNIFIVN